MNEIELQNNRASRLDPHPPQKWISLKERKPAPHRLVYYLTEENEGIGYTNDKGIWLSAPNQFENSPVHFWRELYG